MNTCEVHEVSTLQLGDHVCIWDKTRWPFRYTHHGIVYARGTNPDEIVIAHVWSRINSFRESQADSSFRLTSLTEFLNNRPLSDIRRVQYDASILCDALSMLGETHMSRSDTPPIVIARCNFLLGMGKGHFSILTLNCEHVALWCKTGVVWSKQLFYKVPAKVPFVSSRSSSNALLSLELSLEKLKEECVKKNNELMKLHGKKVYIQLSPTKFIKKFSRDGSLYVVHNDPSQSDIAFRQTPTPFRLFVEIVAYNCVKVMFQEISTGEFLCSKAKCVKLLQRRAYHRDNLFKFEYAWNGELQSRRHRRWYIGVQKTSGKLRTFSIRDSAATFQIVDADHIDRNSVRIEEVEMVDREGLVKNTQSPNMFYFRKDVLESNASTASKSTSDMEETSQESLFQRT